MIHIKHSRTAHLMSWPVWLAQANKHEVVGPTLCMAWMWFLFVRHWGTGGLWSCTIHGTMFHCREFVSSFRVYIVCLKLRFWVEDEFWSMIPGHFNICNILYCFHYLILFYFFWVKLVSLPYPWCFPAISEHHSFWSGFFFLHTAARFV